MPGGTISRAYYPAAPTSVDQRVRIFDIGRRKRMPPLMQ
jgi:hypothetical protein